MTKEELWSLFCEKNPPVFDGSKQLSPRGIRQLFDRTWDIAFKEGKSIGDVSETLFNTLFGSGPRR